MLSEVFHLLKVSAVVAISVALAAAISAVFSAVVVLVFPDVFKEVLLLISMFLPFNSAIVFGGLQAILTILLAFIIANKIYNLNTRSVKSA